MTPLEKLTIHVQTIIDNRLIPIGKGTYLSCKTFVHISANGYTYRINHDKFNYLIDNEYWTLNN